MYISDFEKLCEFLEEKSIDELNYIDCYYDIKKWDERYFEVTLSNGRIFLFYPNTGKVENQPVLDKLDWEDFSTKNFAHAIEAVAYDIACDYHIESCCCRESGNLRFNACTQNIYYDYNIQNDIAEKGEY